MNARVAVALAVTGILAAGGGRSAAKAASPPPAQRVSGERATHGVQETDLLQFQPSNVQVAAGDVVEWVDAGSVAHNVTFDRQPEISSGTMNRGDRYQVRFMAPGTFRYHCTFHPGMDGTVTVS